MNARAYFVADIHWPPERDLGQDAFALFLRDLTREAQERGGVTLYILGDLFDYWFERGGESFACYAPHLEALRAAQEAGVEIVVLFGNRDFLYGQAFTTQTRARLAGDRTVLELCGRRLALEHGDLLCTRDWRYQLYRRVIRSRAARFAARLLTLRMATLLIERMRRASASEIERKSPRALKISDHAVRARRMRGFDVIICGHVHEAKRRQIETARGTGELVTLGAWTKDTGSYARLDEDGLTLTSYAAAT